MTINRAQKFASSATPGFLIALLALSLASCTTSKKRGENQIDGAGLPDPLRLAAPVSAEALAALRQIADDPASMLPPAEAPAATDERKTATSRLSGTHDGEDRHSRSKGNEAPRYQGSTVDEVNPGDIFSENKGTRLRKAFGLLDELDSATRTALLNRFAESETARVPTTFSSEEIDGLRKEHPGRQLPSRSVALDIRTETHTLDHRRFSEVIAAISGGSTDGIGTPERIERLEKEIESVKARLAAGERLRIVTAVIESRSIHASYPDYPAGRRDAILLANTVTSAFPHIDQLRSEKDLDGFRLTRHPRIVWEFDSRELKLTGGEIRIVEEIPARR